MVLALAAFVLAGWALGLPGKAGAATYVFANTSEYDTMDPHFTFDVGRVAYRLNLYDGLMRWEDNPPKLLPWMAESYQISKDGLTYTFKLRAGAKFHDGSPVEAKDVVYSMDRILALKQGAASLFVPLIEPGSSKATDGRTVVFTLNKPSSTFLSTVPEIHIVNSDLLKQHTEGDDWGHKWLNDHDAGSGSYALDRFDPAIGFSANRFPDHFMGWGPKYVDKIEFRTVREPTSRVLGMLRGDFMGTDGYLPIEQVERLQAADNVQVIEQESMRLAVVFIHNQRPPLDDVHVRRAISYAFDYDGFINGILKGSVARNPAPIPRNLWSYPEGIDAYSYNLQKAKEELAKAKVKIDRPIEIHPMVGYVQSGQIAELLQNGMRQIGLEAKIVPETWPTLVSKTKDMATTPDLWIPWVSTYYADPHNWIGEMYSKSNWGSWKASSWYNNPQVHELLNKALTNTDQKVRSAAYEEAARIVMADAGSILIYNTKWYGPFNKKVHGVRFCPIGNGQEARWIYIE